MFPHLFNRIAIKANHLFSAPTKPSKYCWGQQWVPPSWLVIVYCYLTARSKFFVLIYLFLAQLDSAHMCAQMQTSAQFKFALYNYNKWLASIHKRILFVKAFLIYILNCFVFDLIQNSSSNYFLCSGLIHIIPCVDNWKRVDMRMRAFSVPPQDVRQNICNTVIGLKNGFGNIRTSSVDVGFE